MPPQLLTVPEVRRPARLGQHKVDRRKYAALDVAGLEPFVFGASRPALGDTVPERGVGAVSFPNVPAGEVMVTVTPPDGLSCAAWPAGGEMPAVPVVADAVSVVLYQCD